MYGLRFASSILSEFLTIRLETHQKYIRGARSSAYDLLYSELQDGSTLSTTAFPLFLKATPTSER